MKGETLASPTHVCRLDEVEDFRCDVTRLPSARNPLRDLAEGDGLAASTGDLGAEGRREGRASAGSPSRKKSRFGRDAHAVAVAAASTPPPSPRRRGRSRIAAVRTYWATTRRAAAAAFANVQRGRLYPIRRT